MSSNTSEELILRRAEVDLEAGIAYNVTRIRASGHPIFARAMEAGVNAAIHTIRLRQQFRGDVHFVCDLARRAHAGEDPVKLADEHVARALRIKELSLIAREKDPEFQVVLRHARDLLAARLPDLGRLLAIDAPADYDDLVRRAFPERKHVESIVADNRLRVLAILDHVAQHPHLLRVPASWIPKLQGIARDLVEWETARVLEGVDEIYSTRSAT